jgi:UDP:flavonoid glycosyltransferase YjiC (YdhE family)
MKILLCGFSTPGFLHPLLYAGVAARRRGHDVLVVSGPQADPAIAAAGLTRASWPPGERLSFDIRTWPRQEAVTLQFLYTAQAIRAWQPDVVLTSVLALGPLLAAEQADLPVAVLGLACHLWAASEATSRDDDPGTVWWRYEGAGLIYEAARVACGLPARTWSPETFPMMGDRLLLRSVPRLEPQRDLLPPSVGFVGPCLWEPPDPDPAAVQWLTASQQRRPTLYAQLGRTFGAGRLWHDLTVSLAGVGAAAVVNLNRYDGAAAPWPEFLRRTHADGNARLLARCDGAIGSSTTTATLSALVAAKPLFAMPGGAEQPLVASAVARLGALRRADPAADLPGQLARYLGDRALWDTAAELSQELRAVPADAIVDECEHVAAGTILAQATDD